MSVAHVVEGEAHPVVAVAGEDLAHPGEIGDDLPLGDLQHELFGAPPGRLQDEQQLIGTVNRIEQGQGADVEEECPVRELTPGGIGDGEPAAEPIQVAHPPAPLCLREEVLDALPGPHLGGTGQRLVTDDDPIVQPADRLVDDPQLVVADGAIHPGRPLRAA